MKFTISVLAAWLCIFSIQAQTGVDIEHFKGVDQTVNAFLNTWDIEGGSVAITKDGKLIYNKGFGFSDQANAVAATPNSRYRIASVSKPITAIAIMKLVQEGRLSLDDKIFGPGHLLDRKYYSGVIRDKRIYDITVRNLLEHTAGWDRKAPYKKYRHSDPAFYPLEVTEEMGEANPVGDSTLIRFSLKNGLQFKPGAKYSYSNVGYLVLGKVIEQLSGMTYEHYVRQEILDPLSMHDVQLGRNLKSDKLEREAEYSNEYSTASVYGDGKEMPWQYGGFNLEAMNAHGGWVASASDLTRLMLALDGSGLLKPEMIKTMVEPAAVNEGYAKGWCVNAGGNWWHTGSLDGSSSFICRTSGGYTWAFLFNSRADNSSAFWNAFDRLPWDCLKTIKEIPAIDLYAPDENASAVYASVLDEHSATISWKNGSGDGRIVLASERPIQSGFPLDGQDYRANATFGKGNMTGRGVFVVYKGEGHTVTLTQLDPSKRYYISVFEYYKNEITQEHAVYTLGDCGKTIVSTNPAFAQKPGANSAAAPKP